MKLDPDVYEPAEDTALLLRVIAEDEPDLRGARAIDVGTGTGAIARALQDAGARVLAVDVSPRAARLARENGVVAVVRGDLLTATRGPFDIITFNAPYLPSGAEERVEGWLDHAFHGGEEGIEVSARFVGELPRVLAPRGRAYLVVSSRADLAALASAVERSGFSREVVGTVRFFFEEIAVWRLAVNP